MSPAQPGFQDRPPQAKGRQGVVRFGKLITGGRFASPNHLFRFSRESDLCDFLSRRIDITASKFMFAAAACYAEGMLNPRLFVEGAQVQHGRGHSGWRRHEGKTYLVGTEAAHFGVGTITRQGEAVSVSGARGLLALATREGIPKRGIPTSFEASSDLISYGLAQDASTYYAPAYINRAEGLLEVSLQHFLLGVLPVTIPDGGERLEGLLNATGNRVLEALTKHKVAIRPMQDRLSSLEHHTGASEFVQDPSDVPNLIFGGGERPFLRAKIAAYQNAEFQGLIERVANRIFDRARELTELADRSRTERAAARASGG
jgi:hypothetical protein